MNKLDFDKMHQIPLIAVRFAIRSSTIRCPTARRFSLASDGTLVEGSGDCEVETAEEWRGRTTDFLEWK